MEKSFRDMLCHHCVLRDWDFNKPPLNLSPPGFAGRFALLVVRVADPAKSGSACRDGSQCQVGDRAIGNITVIGNAGAGLDVVDFPVFERQRLTIFDGSRFG